MDYILSILVVLGSVLNGFALIKRYASFIDTKIFKPLSLGTAFFIGILFLIVSIRSFAFIFENAFIGVSIFVCLSVVLIFDSRHYLRDIGKSYLTVRNCSLFSLLFVILFILILIFWLRESDLNDPFAMIGSLHSVRYVNLAQFILDNNYIPVIGQNTGQSTLAYVVLAMGAKSGYIALTTFLVSSIMFLSMIIYSLFNIYLKNKTFSIIATFIFFTANTALSTSHILIIDSGSPFFLNGYTDTLVGIFIILMLTIIYNKFSQLEKLNLSHSTLILFLLVGTFYVAPQNILLIIGVFTTLIILRISIKHKYTIGLLLFFSLIITIPQGGMLTPSSLQDNSSIQGMMTIKADGTPTIRVHPGIMYHIQNKDEFNGKPHYERIKDIQLLLEKHEYRSVLFYLEEMTVTSLRMLFFPILGFVLLYIFTNKMKEDNFSEHEFFTMNVLKTFGLLLFIIGFVVTFSVDVHGRKWEMARFLIPGIVFGMFGFILSVFYQLQKSQRYTSLKIVAVIIVTAFGPLSNFVLTIEKRVSEEMNTKILKERYNAYSVNKEIKLN